MTKCRDFTEMAESLVNGNLSEVRKDLTYCNKKEVLEFVKTYQEVSGDKCEEVIDSMLRSEIV